MTLWRFALDFRTFDQGFSLAVNAVANGPIVGLFGPSGGGKSTVLEAMLGWTPSGSAVGSVTCDRTIRMAPVRLSHRGLIWAPQDAPLVNNQTTVKNLLLGDPDATRERVLAVLAAVDLSEPTRLAGNLSGGERQRLSLARAVLGAERCRRLGTATPLLLLDEPLAAVDRSRRWRLLKWLHHEILTQKFAALFVSHAWDEIESFCDHALILADGRLHASGIPAAIRSSAESL